MDPKIKKIHPSTLEKIEQYRMLLLKNLKMSDIRKELNISDRYFKKIKGIYKQIYYNPEAIEIKTFEIVEKVNLIYKKSFNDYLTNKISTKEYILVNQHYIYVLERFGLIPRDVKLNPFNDESDINTKLRSFEYYIKELEQKKKNGLL